MPRLALPLVLLLAGCGVSEPRLTAPAVPPDQPPEIRVEGLRAGQAVELRAAWGSDDRSLWTSRTALRADDAGRAVAGPDPTLVDRVVALVPSSRVGFADVSGRRPAWTWTGEPLEPRTPIEVERIRGPVLAVGAGQDTVWFSKAYVNEIEKRGGARVAPLHYEGAGHAVGGPLPYLPSRPTNLTGGTPEADEEARRDLWPRILDFLR